jgi:hypothetical protein
MTRHFDAAEQHASRAMQHQFESQDTCILSISSSKLLLDELTVVFTWTSVDPCGAKSVARSPSEVDQGKFPTKTIEPPEVAKSARSIRTLSCLHQG